MDRLADFYVGVFEAERIDVPAPPGTRSLLIQLTTTAGFVVMEVADNPHVTGSTAPLTRGHLDHVAFDVGSPQILEQVRRRLVERGATDGSVSDYGTMLAVPFTDPDGMESEVCWLRGPIAEAVPPVPLAGSLLDL
jgi:hypothetical protein